MSRKQIFLVTTSCLKSKLLEAFSFCFFTTVTAIIARTNAPKTSSIGSRCLAVVDGESASLVDRTAVVDLIEAVHTIVLD